MPMHSYVQYHAPNYNGMEPVTSLINYQWSRNVFGLGGQGQPESNQFKKLLQ